MFILRKRRDNKRFPVPGDDRPCHIPGRLDRCRQPAARHRPVAGIIEILQPGQLHLYRRRRHDVLPRHPALYAPLPVPGELVIGSRRRHIGYFEIFFDPSEFIIQDVNYFSSKIFPGSLS